MKKFERKLPRQPSQEICDDQFQIGINNLERAYSFNQAIENKENTDQGNDSNNVRQRNQKIFGNSQEISCIYDDHESFQNLSDLVTDPLSSIKRQTLCDESVQKSKYDLHKIKSTSERFSNSLD